MKVLLVATSKAGTKGAYIRKAFENLGWCVNTFDDWNYGFSKSPRYVQGVISRLPRVHEFTIRTIADRLFIKQVKLFKPDLIFLSRSDRISYQALEAAKAESAAMLVHWFPDGAIHPASDHLRATLPILDKVFVKDSHLKMVLDSEGFTHVEWLPQSCSRDMHRRMSLTKWERKVFKSDITSVLTITPERIQLLLELTKYDLKIWCDRAKYVFRNYPELKPFAMNRRVFGVDQSKVFLASKIVLNHHRSTDVHGLNLRTFEAAGCGAFQLVNRKTDLAASFEEGKEIICYDSEQEALELVAYYLTHDQERQQIADRAYRRAHAEHTYEHRLQTILDTIGLSYTVPQTSFA